MPVHRADTVGANKHWALHNCMMKVLDSKSAAYANPPPHPTPPLPARLPTLLSASRGEWCSQAPTSTHMMYCHCSRIWLHCEPQASAVFTWLIIEIRIFSCLKTCRRYVRRYVGRFFVAVCHRCWWAVSLLDVFFFFPLSSRLCTYLLTQPRISRTLPL